MDKLRILCPYCNEVWSATMEQKFDCSTYCESIDGSDYLQEYIDDGEIAGEIYCSNCKKLVYKKETKVTINTD